MKRKKYLETVLDILEEDLQQMSLDDDYEIYGSPKTNVDDDSVILLIDFPNDVTRAFEFPYEDEMENEEEVRNFYLGSGVRQTIHDAILEDATTRGALINELRNDNLEEDYDEDECYEY